MKLISKSTIDAFSGQEYTMQSVAELHGRQPFHIPGVTRLKNQDFGLLQITEFLGNVYGEDVNMRKMKEIDTYSYTWDIETTQIPTIRFARANTNDGTSGEFTIYTNSRYFSKTDVAALQNTQQILFKSNATQVSDNVYKYTVASWGNGSNAIETSYTAQNSTLRWVYNVQPEMSELGYSKNQYNMERHINYLTKVRVGRAYSSDFRATMDKFFVSDDDYAKLRKDGKRARGFKVYKYNSVEEEVMHQFMIAANGALLFGRANMDEQTGRPLEEVDGSEIIAGDGLIAQYERYAYPVYYNTLSVRNFEIAMDYIRDKRGQSQGNHVTVLCNRQFSNQKAKALQNAINLFAPQNNGTWFFSKEDPLKGVSDAYGGMSRMKRKQVPHDVAVGATFNTYIYEGNTITFVVDEALTKHFPDRGYAIFIDTGIYEDERGQVPAIELKTLKGREMIKGHVVGMGGVDGTSNGSVSTPLDASRYDILGWRGVCVKSPYSAVIFEELV